MALQSRRRALHKPRITSKIPKVSSVSSEGPSDPAARIETSSNSLAFDALSCTHPLSIIVVVCRFPSTFPSVQTRPPCSERAFETCSSSLFTADPTKLRIRLKCYRRTVQYFHHLLIFFLARSSYESDLNPKKYNFPKKLKILDIPSLVQIGRSN